MPQKVQFEGQVHEFPDSFSVEDISKALSSYSPQQEAEPTPPPIEVQSARNATTGNKQDFSRSGEGPLKMSSQGERFRSIIQRIETGSGDPWIRTRARPSGTEKGSSAYGPYQITRKLLSETLEQSSNGFTSEETDALTTLIERQGVALEIGGRDRSMYEQGGGLNVQARAWARQFGYEDVKTFLDDFDYGGSLGLGDNLEFQMGYETAARKLLARTLKDNNGDAEKAAAEWHGGKGWEKAAHRKRTESYLRKYRSYSLEADNNGEWSDEDLTSLRD